MPLYSKEIALLDEGEEKLYHAHPAMFRNHPIWFVLACLLVPIGVGVVILVAWWLDTRAKTLIVTTRRTILRRGILSKSLSDIQNADVRNIQVEQTALQRLLGVGSLKISSAGQAGIEMVVNGIPDPNRAREAINRSR
jgi:uncharacterized membrane protein YdbT with pleckstrin-like domain